MRNLDKSPAASKQYSLRIKWTITLFLGISFRLSTALSAEVISVNNIDPQAADYYGASSAISNNYIAIGSWGDDNTGPESGSVTIFNSSGDYLYTIENSHPEYGLYGFPSTSLSINGSFIAMGGGRASSGLANSGRVEVYNLATQQIEYTLEGTGQNYFGSSVVLTNDYLVVGERRAEVNGTEAGKVYIYSSADGSLIREIPNPSPTFEDLFGLTLDVSGNDLIIGAYGEGEDAGAVYNYDLVTGNLNYSISNPNGSTTDRFGYQVDASTDHFAVSSVSYDNSSGAVYIYETSTGNLQTTILNPDGVSGDQFGSALSIDGTKILIGSRYSDKNGLNSGTAFLYDWTSDSIIQRIDNPSPADGDNFGATVNLLGDTALITANADNIGSNDTGAGYLYLNVAAQPSGFWECDATCTANSTSQSPVAVPEISSNGAATSLAAILSLMLLLREALLRSNPLIRRHKFETT